MESEELSIIYNAKLCELIKKLHKNSANFAKKLCALYGKKIMHSQKKHLQLKNYTVCRKKTNFAFSNKKKREWQKY